MGNRKRVSLAAARELGDAMGIDWQTLDVEEFRLGVEIEASRVTWDASTTVAFDDALVTGRLAFVRLIRIPDYYSDLEAAEEEADAYWADV